MDIIVCGAGRVGYGIAKHLAREEHNVTVIDENAELVDQTMTDLNVVGVVGNGAHPDVLKAAQAGKAELIIAVTQHDEINMVICQVAKTLFNVGQTIARIRSPVFREQRWKDLFSKEGLPIDLIFSPEHSVAEAVAERFNNAGAVMSARFADGKVQLLAFDMDEDDPLLGTNLDQIADLFPDLDARIVGIGKSGRIQAPRSNDSLRPGDRAYIAVLDKSRQRLSSILDREESAARLVTIIGAGNVGIDVAERLSAMSGVRVRIIELDAERARQAVKRLRKAVVIRGDALDMSVLEEAGGARSDFLIALTNDDRTNLLVCGLAKKLGTRRTMALINEPELAVLKRQLDIDAIVDPRALTVSEILQRVRRGRIKALRSLEDGKAEVVEGITLENSPLIGQNLDYDDMPDGIAAVVLMRGGEIIFPGPDVTVRLGDRITLLFEEERLEDVERFFRASAGFF